MTHHPRTRDEAGRIRRPCPHCGDLTRQRFVNCHTDDEGNWSEVWNCDSPTCPKGSHSYATEEPSR